MAAFLQTIFSYAQVLLAKAHRNCSRRHAHAVRTLPKNTTNTAQYLRRKSQRIYRQVESDDLRRCSRKNLVPSGLCEQRHHGRKEQSGNQQQANTNGVSASGENACVTADEMIQEPDGHDEEHQNGDGDQSSGTEVDLFPCIVRDVVEQIAFPIFLSSLLLQLLDLVAWSRHGMEVPWS